MQINNNDGCLRQRIEAPYIAFDSRDLNRMKKQLAFTSILVVIGVVVAVVILFLEEYLLQYSYLGVFVISFIGAMSVIVPIPYTVVILTLGLEGMNPLWLTAVGGLGSSLGELYGYILGYYGRAGIREEQQRRMEYMIKIFDHYGPITIFLFALTPLPDDLLFIPLGMMRYPISKAFIPSILGKTVMSAILAYGGRSFGTLLSALFGESTPLMRGITTLITMIALILIIVAMIKLDWEKIFEKYVGVDKEKEDPQNSRTGN